MRGKTAKSTVAIVTSLLAIGLVQTSPAHAAQAPAAAPLVAVNKPAPKAHISWNLWKMAKNFIHKMTHTVGGRLVTKIGGKLLFVLGLADTARTYVNICKHRPIVMERWNMQPHCKLSNRDYLRIFVGI